MLIPEPVLSTGSTLSLRASKICLQRSGAIGVSGRLPHRDARAPDGDCTIT
jgi:hypothetical protein